MTQTQHPRFFGWFPSNAALASVLGDLASSGVGALGITWQSAPGADRGRGGGHRVAARAHRAAPQWRGAIHDTASTACLVAMLAARERATDYSQARGGLQAEPAPLTVYTSAARALVGGEGGAARRVRPGQPARSSTSTRSPTRCARTRSPPRSRPTSPPDAVPLPSWSTSAPPGRPRSTRSRRSCRSLARTACGCTWTPRWPARRCCCRRCAGWSRASTAPTRCPGTRTSGWARSWTARCCTCATRSTWSG